MKIKKLILISIISTYFMICYMNAWSMTTGFFTEDVDDKEEKNFLANVHMSMLYVPRDNQSIKCFDVNDNGMIALGFENSEKKIIEIYSSEGQYMYSYSFECYGTFGLEWDDNNIMIYFVRSNMAVLFDENGQCLEIKKIQDGLDNNTYWNHCVFVNERFIDGKKYMLQSGYEVIDIFLPNWQLVSIDENGNKLVIYDVTNGTVSRFVAIGIMVFIIIGITILIITNQNCNNRKK